MWNLQIQIHTHCQLIIFQANYYFPQYIICGITDYCLLPPSFLSFFPPPFPFPCSPLHFCPPWAIPFCSWAVWTFSIREKQSSSGLIWLLTNFPWSSDHDVSACASPVAPGLGDDGLEWAFLGLVWLGEQCLDLTSSLGTRFKLKDKGLPGAGLRGITRLSPGAPRVRKTSGNPHGWLIFFCPFYR